MRIKNNDFMFICREPPEENKGPVQWCDLQRHLALFVSSQERMLGSVPARRSDLRALPKWWHGWEVRHGKGASPTTESKWAFFTSNGYYEKMCCFVRPSICNCSRITFSQRSGTPQEMADPREGCHQCRGAGVSPEAVSEWRTSRTKSDPERSRRHAERWRRPLQPREVTLFKSECWAG